MGSMCKIVVNGKEHEFDGDRKLMDVLRNDLRLTSVKNGCSEGTCGACTVLVDGKPQRSCITSISRIEGKEVTTVEGISEEEKEIFAGAFGETGAVQCGFCMPGVIMTTKALLAENPNPTREECAKALRFNICRCTGYKKIIDAIQRAAQAMQNNEQFSDGYEKKVKVGDRMVRQDAREKVLGSAKYTDDIVLDGMLYGSCVRSQYPRAKVLKIDTSQAEALEGVAAVFTYDDVPGNNTVGHLVHDWDTFIPEGGITRFVGDALALVVAEDEETLEKAKKLVNIEYEELTPMTCPEEALKEDAPHIHENGNIVAEKQLVHGDADKAIAESAHVVTRTYHTPWNEHAFLEPECAVAKPYEDGVWIYTSDQSVYDTRKETSILLGLDEEKVIVENMYVGGGFGGKEDVTVQHIAAMAAYLLKRPVKCRFTREESLTFHPKRRPMTVEMTTACDEKGFLTGMKARISTDNGAYASLGGPVLERACTHAAGPYNYQNCDVKGVAVYTNNPPTGAFRGFGVTQSCFACEMNIDLLAEECGIDPWQFRYQNAIRPGQELANGQIVDEATNLVATLEAVKDDFYANEHVGIACGFKNTGLGIGLPDTGRARLTVEDGMVHVWCGAADMGQGAEIILIQDVCDALDLAPEKVIWHHPNTSTTPNSGTSSASRQTLFAGEAARQACLALKKDLDANNGDWSCLEGKEYKGEWLGKTDPMGCDKPNPKSHVAYSYATHLCILNEDGTIKKIIAAHDVGQAINPPALEGQIEGGVVMSCGYALTEKYELKDGRPAGKFGKLGLFRADKTPDVEPRVVDVNGTEFGFGAKGVGEISCIPVAPAIDAAYYELTGEFQTDLPLKNTPYAKK